MRIIKDLTDEIRGNIDEAECKIDTAYGLFDECRTAADWYKDMAVAHLNFNTAGHALVKRLIDERKAKDPESDLTPGMLSVYDAIHADLIKRSAKVKSMIDNYGK